ncbi:MAG TPA: DUF748 domain-containing protein [Burkholderiaceae bacterium]|nr:DUF748 domain-containing protein [Burkholderiaceae bacterium]
MLHTSIDEAIYRENELVTGMTKQKFKRVALTGVLLIVALATGVSLGLRFATKALKNQVEHALGANAEVGAIVVGWSRIELRDVNIRAPSNWPADETLRAGSVVITPDLRALISSKLSIGRIDINDPYISILRSREGRLRLLPSMFETAGKADAEAGAKSKLPEISIGDIEIHNGIIEFFDASIKQPAHKIRLEQLDAGINSLHVPNIAGRTGIRIAGNIKGQQHDGKLAIDGWIDVVGQNSDVSTKLQDVDLIALQPYLIKTAETGVRRGSLDLDLKSTVHDNHLNAPGRMTLTGLELDTGNGAMSTFMGVPRKAVIASLQNRKDQIIVPFTLEGNLNDPHFSLNESLAAQFGSGIASTLGIGIEGLAHGVGNAAQGMEGMVKKLIGK